MHSPTTWSIFDKSFRWIYDLGNNPTARGFLGHVPRNHGPHSSNISTKSPTSSGSPKRMSPCQLWMAKIKWKQNGLIYLKENNFMQIILESVSKRIIIIHQWEHDIAIFPKQNNRVCIFVCNIVKPIILHTLL